MTHDRPRFTRAIPVAWVASIAAAATGIAMASLVSGGEPPSSVLGMAAPSPLSTAPARPGTTLTWRLNNPAPSVVPESRANPAAVSDKFAARSASVDQRSLLRAYEGAPPVIPHTTADLNIQTCRACHAQGLRAGDKVARMVSHTYLTNCTQCHVEGAGPLLGPDPGPSNTFAGLRSSGYGGTRAWAGAPPVMPHTAFMRTNCVSCHGEFGYDGWRPDHLSRSNCVQCHAPSAQFDQLGPAFGEFDVADGVLPAPGH